MMNYMPRFYDTEDREWTILELHFCINFGGRSIEMECQWENSGKFYTKWFVYYYLTNTINQWDANELVSVEVSADQPLIKQFHTMYKLFDNPNKD